MQTRLAKTLLRSPYGRDGFPAKRECRGFCRRDGGQIHVPDRRQPHSGPYRGRPFRGDGRSAPRPAYYLFHGCLAGKDLFGEKIMFLNPIVNEADRSIKVVAEVDNRNEQLKSGLFVTGRIKTGERKGVIKIPRAALLTWDVPGKRGKYSSSRETWPSAGWFVQESSPGIWWR